MKNEWSRRRWETLSINFAIFWSKNIIKIIWEAFRRDKFNGNSNSANEMQIFWGDLKTIGTQKNRLDKLKTFFDITNSLVIVPYPNKEHYKQTLYKT